MQIRLRSGKQLIVQPIVGVPTAVTHCCPRQRLRGIEVVI